ncbi:propionyl-CoA synthetase [Thiothrix nivea]|uniref:Propionyl-CoA synthetase n=1 Tax=Thiothrix nivea (strain ATCC 35100 / DSM 5205 / JP2) TaxID=870187 RepID=A0A656HAB4_THINJ|nr:propionyl-CoA synthetase [Thiothrix nivea]EIJ33022.1 propionyl-CoA synthetase [Thiothrix nivea DSM 5205]
MSYKAEYERSMNDPEGFWKEKAAALKWFKNPENILSQDEHGIYHWFADGEMNTAYMALDYHVEQGRGDQLAIIYDSPVTDTKTQYTYAQLRDEVAKAAGMLKELGVEKGDRVIIYMPMIPEAVISMLAVARLGAIHSVVFGGFAAPELAVRIEDAQPKVMISASCGVEIKRVIEYKPLLDKAIALSSHKPQSCIIFQRPQATSTLIEGRDHDWNELYAKAEPADCVPVKGTDPLYILYTSGTTGKPKGVVRENGGHAVAMNYSMQAIYNVDKGDVFWAASDVGWVVGHSYIVYAPLLRGCTTIVFEGKPIMTPDAGAFWRICEEYKVKTLFTAPTAFRAIKKEDSEGAFFGKYDLSNLVAIFSAGERLDPPTQEWLMEKSGKPVIDHWWQTETGWGITANLQGIEPMPVKLGSSTVPTPGFNVKILDDAGRELSANEQGYIALKLPLPPSCLATVWGDVEKFKDSYLSSFPGYYASGDGGYIDEDGYVFVMGRVDDVINVAGHRLSTGEMEEVVGGHPSVAECAVVARDDDLKGQIPMGLVVLKSGVEADEAELGKELVQLIRSSIGAIACYKDTYIVKRLPKTRSGKILRKSMRQMVNGQPYAVPSTIDDPGIMPEIEALLKEKGVIG